MRRSRRPRRSGSHRRGRRRRPACGWSSPPSGPSRACRSSISATMSRRSAGSSPAERLVEEQHRPRRQHGAGERDALALAARQLGRAALRRARRGRPAQRPATAARSPSPRRSEGDRAEPGIVGGGEVGQQVVLLEHDRRRAGGAAAAARGRARRTTAGRSRPRSKPAIALRSVDLPPPDGPTSGARGAPWARRGRRRRPSPSMRIVSSRDGQHAASRAGPRARKNASTSRRQKRRDALGLADAVGAEPLVEEGRQRHQGFRRRTA